MAMLLRFGRRNDRRVGVALLDLEMFADMGAAPGWTKTGNRGVRLTMVERVLRGRVASLAPTVRAARFFARTARPRMLELIEEWFESSESVEFRRAMQLLAAESAAVVRRFAVRVDKRVVERIVERVAEICAARLLPELIVMEGASARFSEFLRASSPWASRAWTSASTHSSKISCSSLRRFATAFRRLRWKDSIEAPDDVKRYSRARSIAPSRDGKSWFASPFVPGIAEIDITQVITSYSIDSCSTGLAMTYDIGCTYNCGVPSIRQKIYGGRLRWHARLQAFSVVYRVRFREPAYF